MKNGGADFDSTKPNKFPAHLPREQGMVFIPGGEFSMGGINPVGMDKGGHEMMTDARPVHRVYVKAFLMDETEVTNAMFAQFVRSTGYVTVAELKPIPEEFPGVAEKDIVAGSLVFTPPSSEVSLRDFRQWWTYLHRANWRHPEGPGSDITGKDNYPVVQISWEDTTAYARWVGKRLPIEPEWEFAARGGRTGNLYPWGNELKPQGKYATNIFEGEFPGYNSMLDGFAGQAPVRQFTPNSYGLYDMAGNAWEWCSDWYRPDYYQFCAEQKIIKNPQGPEDPFDPTESGQKKSDAGWFLFMHRPVLHPLYGRNEGKRGMEKHRQSYRVPLCKLYSVTEIGTDLINLHRRSLKKLHEDIGSTSSPG